MVKPRARSTEATGREASVQSCSWRIFAKDGGSWRYLERKGQITVFGHMPIRAQGDGGSLSEASRKTGFKRWERPVNVMGL